MGLLLVAASVPGRVAAFADGVELPFDFGTLFKDGDIGGTSAVGIERDVAQVHTGSLGRDAENDDSTAQVPRRVSPGVDAFSYVRIFCVH